MEAADAAAETALQKALRSSPLRREAKLAAFQVGSLYRALTELKAAGMSTRASLEIYFFSAGCEEQRAQQHAGEAEPGC